MRKMAEQQINPSENLLELIHCLINEKYYDGIPVLLQEERNRRLLREVSDEIFKICKMYLTPDYHDNNFELYSAIEMLLKALAQYSLKDEMLFDLLETIEITGSENVFTSVLKALQACILSRMSNYQRALDWSFSSILTYIHHIEVPKQLKYGYDEKEEKVLEQNDQVQRILSSYVIVSLYYEPILWSIIEHDDNNIFMDKRVTPKNIILCFLMQLLNKPLALCDLSNDCGNGISYAFQCAEKFVRHICKLVVNPFFFLDYVEKRARWKPKPIIVSMKKRNKKNENNDDYRDYNKSDDEEIGSTTMSKNNSMLSYSSSSSTSSSSSSLTTLTEYETYHKNDIFLNEARLPFKSIGIFYYLIIGENLLPNNAPKIYNPLYIFESCLYLVVDMIDSPEAMIQFKGIQLGLQILDNLHDIQIPVNSLDLQIHSNFCNTLTKCFTYSENERNRGFGIKLLRNYVLKFENEGRYILIKNLMKITENNNNLLGYIFVMYKNLIAEQLEQLNASQCTQEQLSEHFKGKHFKNILMNYICKLKNDIETDLADSSDHVLSALNVIRYFAIADTHNYTGFWNFINEIQVNFLQSLRVALDLSRAHYKAEELRIRNYENKCANYPKMNGEYNMLVQSITQDFESELPKLTKEDKLNVLSHILVNFDLIESILARVNECIDSALREREKV